MTTADEVSNLSSKIKNSGLA